MSIIQTILIALGLSMDAAAVSMSNGLYECKMSAKKTIIIALAFGLFQGIMPLFGYLLGLGFANVLSIITPYIALVLLSIIGIKMICDSKNNFSGQIVCLTGKALIYQAIATSIDALAVGLVYAQLAFINAVTAFIIIAVITFIVALVSIVIGKKFGTKLQTKAQVLGGLILIAIGIKMFVSSII